MFALILCSYLLEIPDDAYTQHLVISDWLFNTQSRILQAAWFILEINEKATEDQHALFMCSTVGQLYFRPRFMCKYRNIYMVNTKDIYVNKHPSHGFSSVANHYIIVELLALLRSHKSFP